MKIGMIFASQQLLALCSIRSAISSYNLHFFFVILDEDPLKKHRVKRGETVYSNGENSLEIIQPFLPASLE